jgi:hypothetical protein
MRRWAGVPSLALGTVLAGAIALLSPRAWAQGFTITEPSDAPAPLRLREQGTHAEVEMLLGGGGFTGDVGKVLDRGPTWALRVAQTRYKVLSAGFEWMGTVAGSPLESGSVVTHAFDLSFRFSPLGSYYVSPYVLLRFGALFVNARPVTNTTPFAQGGWAGETPVGGGLVIRPVSWLGFGVEAGYTLLWARSFTVSGLSTSNANMWFLCAQLSFYL